MLGTGNPDAEICFVEDTPIDIEMGLEKLFIGGTNWTFETQLKTVGLTRKDVWITALFGHPGNSATFYSDKEVTKLRNDYLIYPKLLLNEFLKLPKLKIIVPMGNYSLYHLTGMKGISNWRGSVLSVTKQFSFIHFKKWKVIPTYSPRTINTKWALRIYQNIDLRRVIAQKEFKHIIRPIRQSIVAPTFQEAKNFLERLIKDKSEIGMDIETDGKNTMTCISFAPSPWLGISIPYFCNNGKPYWAFAEYTIIDGLVRQIINDAEHPKVLQNGMFDFWMLKSMGYKPQGMVWDTMYASHCQFCELPKDLGTLTSIYTDENYYKFERTEAYKEFQKVFKPKLKRIKKLQSEGRKLAKKRASLRKRILRTKSLKCTPKRLDNLNNWSQTMQCMTTTLREVVHEWKIEDRKIKIDLSQFEHEADLKYWLYNIKDSQVTLEIKQQQEKELKQKNLLSFYTKYYVKMFKTAFDISTRGIRIDLIKRSSLKSRVENFLNDLRNQLFDMIGYKFNTQSSVQMAKILYNELNLPKITQGGKVTTSAKALSQLYEKTKHPVLELILDIRKLEKLCSTYLNSELVNGHLQCIMDIAGTNTGRWASKKTYSGFGGNLQNIPSGKTEISSRVLDALGGNKNAIRDLFLPPGPDWLFLDVDLSNADTWFVAFKAKDLMLMDALVTGKDTHKMVWSICGEVSYDEVTKEQRNMAKRIGHGFNYGMHETLLASMLKLPINVVIGMFERLRDTRPAIPKYHRWVEQEIINKRVIYNAWGRPRVFTGRTPYKYVKGIKVAESNQIYRSGYAQIPQSSVADTIGHVINRFQDKNYKLPWIYIALQVHDSLIFAVMRKHLIEGIKLIWEAFDFRMNPWGDEFQIPWSYAIGNSWGNVVELPVIDGNVDFSKRILKDKNTGKESVALWSKYF